MIQYESSPESQSYSTYIDEFKRGMQCIRALYKLIISAFFPLAERVEGGQTWCIQKESCPLCTKKPRDCI